MESNLTLATIMAGLGARDEAVAGRRSRELYKYFTPPSPTNTLAASKTSTADSQLVALSQLVAWRLDCQRSMVSLIDRELQYFVAEATRTLDLEDSTKHDDPSDAIWAGCVSVPSRGRLCEWTISQEDPVDGGPAIFEVLDLASDPRFCNLDFVCGGPGFRYYVGVPLKTKKGIPIGSLFALDNKPRRPLGLSGKAFLGTMADNVMRHLESTKERTERERALNMNMCLAAFVDPEHQTWRRRKRPLSRRISGSKGVKTASAKPSVENLTRASSPPRTPTSPRKKHLSANSQDVKDYGAESACSSDSEGSQQPRVEDNDHTNVFRRAADLLLDSLSLDDGGGVIFLDTTTALRQSFNRPTDTVESFSEGDDEIPNEGLQRRGSISHVQAQLQRASSYNNNDAATKGFHTRLSAQEGLADVLGHSATKSSTNDFMSFVPDDLNKLRRRYPRGKLFTFDREAIVGNSSSGDDSLLSTSTSQSKSLFHHHRPSKQESQMLLKHFPGARQIMFLPLLDPSTARWYSLFVYNQSLFRNLSKNPDFLYCVAFGSCILTEIARLNTLAADQQKSDFIGSISHELRSPLHGILASCEFLEDTKCDSFQKSLISTADSCARTLLDTINMVLDYSKINAFERNAKKAKKGKSGGKMTGTLSQPMMNIYGDVNLAAITEEVVEGVATGQVFKDSLTGAGSGDLHSGEAKNKPGTTKELSMRRAEVDIILDISAAQDWTYVTQPGAFRRVVMNLFGNALKYTKSGFIRVKLELEDTRKHRPLETPTLGELEASTDTLDKTDKKPLAEEPTHNVILTITDTGIGMSPEYLRTKLFTAFAQENHLNPGTGLGLSLVKSIVEMLKGSIDIKSALNVGTEVTVRLPMTTSSSPNGSGSSSGLNSAPSSAGSGIERVKDDSIEVVQQIVADKTAALFLRPHAEKESAYAETAQMFRDTAMNYLTGWFHFGNVVEWSPSADPDLIVVDEMDVEPLKAAVPRAFNRRSKVMVLVMCSTASRHATKDKYTGLGNFEAVCHPFGPFKLAKAIRLCLERNEGLRHRLSVPNEEPTPSPNGKDESMLDQVVRATEQVTLAPGTPGLPKVNVLKQGQAMANEDSMNARMALDGFSPPVSTELAENRVGFPFPMDITAHESPSLGGIVSPSVLSPGSGAPTRPPLLERETISPTGFEIDRKVKERQHIAEPTSLLGAVATNPNTPTTLDIKKPSPRLLLVDDNAVNLRLLQTFMKKRDYPSSHITSASDGLQAVQAFEACISANPPAPPEIVFMDISMPVMNGFEAIRRIRAIEADHRAKLDPMETPAQALIIALTGLASGRDQTEAFTSGCDLFLSKPISFREVGRLLDNWQANGGSKVSVPHGAVVSPDVSEATGGAEATGH